MHRALRVCTLVPFISLCFYVNKSHSIQGNLLSLCFYESHSTKKSMTTDYCYLTWNTQFFMFISTNSTLQRNLWLQIIAIRLRVCSSVYLYQQIPLYKEIYDYRLLPDSYVVLRKLPSTKRKNLRLHTNLSHFLDNEPLKMLSALYWLESRVWEH